MSRAALLLAALLALPLPAVAEGLAELNVVRQGEGQRAVARNTSGGPVEVELVADAWVGMDSEPALPVPLPRRRGHRSPRNLSPAARLRPA